MGVDMAADARLAVALDLSKLLGFKRVAVAAGNEAAVARALGTVLNKAGEGPPPGIRLENALGVLYNKIGEGPPAVQLEKAIGALYNKIGEAG